MAQPEQATARNDARLSWPLAALVILGAAALTWLAVVFVIRWLAG